MTTSPLQLRQQIRSASMTGNTSGLCPSFVQGNLCILPADYANDFLKFCHLNPKPCPIIGMSEKPGDFRLKSLATYKISKIEYLSVPTLTNHSSALKT